MRVLILNQYFPPDTSATARVIADVADALAEAGHDVTVLAGRPSYDPTERRPWRPWQRERRGMIEAERVGSTAFSRRPMAGRVSNYLSYLTLALVRGASLRADLIVAMTDPPLISVVGALIARLRRVPLVYNIRDLHPDMAVAAGLARPNLLVRLWDGLHRWSLRTAHRVIVLGEDMRQRIVEKGVPAERVAVVRDGAAMPGAAAGTDHPVTREVRSGFRFVVLHAGNLGFAGAWDALISAMRRLEGECAGLVFVGDGAALDRLRTAADGRRNIRFLPYRPAGEVPYVLAAGDLHVVTVRRGLEGLVVPSKLYPILGAGRPVLALATEDSDAARIVRETGCGWVVDPDDPQVVAGAIAEAMADGAELDRRAARAREAAPMFERRRLLARWVQEVEAAAVSVT